MAKRSSTVLVLVALGVAGLMASGGTASAAPTLPRQPNEPVDLPAGNAETNEFALTVCQCAKEIAQASGPAAVTPAALRFCVADRWWPTTAWPPIPADPQSVKDAWAMVAAFALAYVDDPPGFESEFCTLTATVVPTGPSTGLLLEPGTIVHSGTINISSVCAPPIPQEVAIRILAQVDDGPDNIFSAEAWAFDELEWQSLDFPGGAMRLYPTVELAISTTAALVLEFAADFCAPTNPVAPESPLPLAPGFNTPTTPVPPPTFTGEVPWQRVEVPSLETYPWELPLIHEGGNGDHYPTPGMFFLVRDDAAPTDPILALDSILGIATVALASAYAMSGEPRQLADIPTDQVRAYVALIACSPWNDKAYGATNPDVVGGTLGLGPHNRGINMLPRHHNNVAALAQGLKALRSTRLAGGIDSAIAGDHNSWPQLWLPPIRLDMLRDMGVVSTAGLEWSNGDSVIVPPPVVWNHNVTTTVSPAGGSWGC